MSLLHTGSLLRLDWKGGQWARQYLQVNDSLVLTNHPWVSIYTNECPTATTNTVFSTFPTNKCLYFRIQVER
jgi:hypothetical protein